MRRLLLQAVSLVTPVLLVGCATRSEFDRLAGRVFVLESQAGGLAYPPADSIERVGIKTKEELIAAVELMQKQVATLTVDIQNLRAQMQQSTGEQTASVTNLERQVSQLQSQFAALEATTRVNQDGQDKVADVSAFRWNSEQQGYDAARLSYQASNYDLALQQFEEMLRRWPKGRYSANGHYWIGDIYFQKQDDINAIDKYLYVTEHYPNNAKAPAALYKMALALKRLGEKAKAKKILQDLIKLYPQAPQTEAAKKDLSTL